MPSNIQSLMCAAAKRVISYGVVHGVSYMPFSRGKRAKTNTGAIIVAPGMYLSTDYVSDLFLNFPNTSKSRVYWYACEGEAGTETSVNCGRYLT